MIDCNQCWKTCGTSDTRTAARASPAPQATERNPLDFVPDEIPFDTAYGLPVSLDRPPGPIQAAVAEAKPCVYLTAFDLPAFAPATAPPP
jgi:hypothetical protein